MSQYSIPDSESLRKEILASHQRCRDYGIDPHMTFNPRQARLSADQLDARRAENRDFLEVATAQIRELYRFVAGADFAVCLTDSEGYVLDIIGDPPMVKHLADGYCIPGYRWTEKDVGTSVISLVLARGIPVQVNDEEHFCKRGYGHTCSASPVFEEGRFLGVLAMSGDARRVHPHTLGMVITAAKAIENQLCITRASRELLVRNDYMNAIIESIDSGVMAVDPDGLVNQINQKGRRILQWRNEPINRTLIELFDLGDDWPRLREGGLDFVDREIFYKGPSRAIHLLMTARPISDREGGVQGIIFVFNEINRIRRLVHEMAGSQARFTFEDIIGVSPGIQEAKKLAILAANSRSTVLLLGETGTGKELFAQSIHNQSNRKKHPFVAINCGAIPRELLESELFGYVEGAFTGARKGGRPGKLELASGGTVFLDEIGDMPFDMQVKMLRVLQTGEVFRVGQHNPIPVDLRIIAATHRELKQEVRRGNFREDLFYRLNVFPITIPPLRQRPEDIVPLAIHILRRCGQVLQKPGIRFSPEAETKLCRHCWPGNVRELENVVERSVSLTQEQMISAGLLDEPSPLAGTLPFRKGQKSALEDAESQVISHALDETRSNISQTAQMLGISRVTLYKKLKKYRLLPSNLPNT